MVKDPHAELASSQKNLEDVKRRHVEAVATGRRKDAEAGRDLLPRRAKVEKLSRVLTGLNELPVDSVDAATRDAQVKDVVAQLASAKEELEPLEKHWQAVVGGLNAQADELAKQVEKWEVDVDLWGRIASVTPKAAAPATPEA